MKSLPNNQLPATKDSFVKIGEAAEKLGVSIDTLRRWEKAGKIETVRTPGGTRLYSTSTLSHLTENPKKYQRNISLPRPGLGGTNQPNIPTSVTTVEDLLNISRLEDNKQYQTPTTDQKWQDYVDERVVKPSEVHVHSEAEVPLSSVIASDQRERGNLSGRLLRRFTPRNDNKGHKIFTFATGALVLLFLSFLVLARASNFQLPWSNGLMTNGQKIPATSSKPLALSNPQVLAAATSNYYLNFNTDLIIEGDLAVGGTINGLTMAPNTDGFSIAGGNTSRKMTVVGGDVTLDQDVSTKGSPSFQALKLPATSNQISMGGAGTLTWTPSGTKIITFPDATGTVLLDSATQTITNKTISGSSNTISNIQSSALSGSYTGITGLGTITTGTWNGTKIGVGYGGTGLTSYTIGDTLYASASDTLAKLPIGTAGQALIVSNGIPAWSSLTGSAIVADSIDFTEIADSMTLDANLAISASTNNYSINIDSGTLFVDTANNRVGVGTIIPSYTLDVNGIVNATALYVGGAPYIGSQWTTQGSAIYYTGGNVGIGTTNPIQALDLATGSSYGINGVAILSAGALTFSGASPIISASTAATDISLNPGAGGNILLAGGSTSTGCTVNDTTGNLTCTGDINGGSTGTAGYWTRAGTSLSPSNAGDSITTSGGISTTGSGTLSVAGTATFSSTINSNTFTSTALTFAGTTPVISASTAATDISLNPGAGGNVQLAGGSGSFGCSINDTTGDLTCTGAIASGGTGVVGYWQTDGGSPPTLSPATTGANVTTSGNISTSGTGTITSGGLLTGQTGLTITGGTASLNASSNNNTNINTGNSSGAISIGNSLAGAITMQSGAASTFAAPANTATAFRFTDGTNAYQTLDTRNTLSGVSAHTFAAGTAPTIASASNAEFTTLTTTPPTITLTGTTQVTSQMDSILFNAPTITDSSAITVDKVATFTINGAPVSGASGLATITDSYGLKINTSSVDSGTGTVTNAYGMYIEAPTGATNNYGLTITADSITNGKGLNLTSTSTGLTTGNMFNLDWSPTGSTNIYATGDLMSVGTGNAFAFVGNLFNVKSQGSSVFSVSDTSVTTSIPANFTSPGDVSMAYDLNFTNPTASYIKSAAPLYITAGKVFNSSDLVLTTYNQGSIVLAKDFTSTAAVTNYLSQINGTDITAIANTNYGLYSSITHTGNAAKIGVGLYSTLSTSSTTADTLIAADLATSTTGIITTGTRNIYGLRNQPSSTAASTGGTTNIYGEYIKSGGVVGAGGTINNYGMYIANGTMDTTGTSTNTGLYVETPSGADTNYAAIFAGGNVGIGVAAPSATLDLVGTFQYTDGNQALNKILTSDASGNATWQTFASAGGVTGTGTSNYVTKWSGTSTLSIGTLWDNGTQVGIGTTNPTAAFSIGELLQINSSGLLFAPLGSSTAPSLSFMGDPNTGIFSAGADILSFATGGTERMRMDASGNIGIGTTNTSNSGVTIGAGGGSLYLNTDIQNTGANYSGKVQVSDDLAVTGTVGISTTANQLTFSTTNVGTLTWTPTGTRTITIPDTTGTLAVGIGTSASLAIWDGTNSLTTTTNLPTATTIGSGYIYRVGGTDVAVADGGTGLSTIAAGSIWAANTLDTISAITSTSGTKVLKNVDGTVSWDTVAGTGGITGTGTSNYVSRWTGTSTQGTGIIWDDGTNVGIGTTAPVGKFDITNTSNTVASLTLTNNTATTIGNGTNTLGVIDLQSTSLTTGNFLNIELNALSSGKGLNLTSTSTTLSSGSLASFDWSPTGTTNIYSTGDLVSISTGNAFAFVGNLLNIKSQGSSVFSVSDVAVTANLPASFTSPGDVSMAYDLNFTNPTASYIKSQAPLYIQAGDTPDSTDLTLTTFNQGSIIFTKDFTGSAVTNYLSQIAGTDSTANANTNYGLYSSITHTGNAAKIGVGLYSTLSTSSTTADTLIAADLATSTTGIMTTGTRNIYGLRSQPASTAASTGGTTNIYGSYLKSGGVVGAGGTINSYGMYIANGTMDTTGTSTNTGLYVETPSGADTNYAAIFAGGNVGIGTTVPAGLLDLTGTSNTAATLSLTNNTANTIGAGANTIGVLDLQSTSLTTGNLINVETTALTTGNAINILGPASGSTMTGSVLDITSNIGAGGKLINLTGTISHAVDVTAASNIYSAATINTTGGTLPGGINLWLNTTNAPTNSANSAYGIYSSLTDTSTLGNTNYGIYNASGSTGNAAKTLIGTYSITSSTSTTADTLISSDSSANVSGIITTGTRNVYGVRSQPGAGAESTGGTTNVYGLYSKASADVGVGGTVNAYGLYVANGTYDTDGTSKAYGLYVESPTGADTNYAAIFAGGNVGIGTTAPARSLETTGSIRMGALIAGGGTAVAMYRDANGDLADSTSSILYKTDVTPYSSVLDKVMQLNAVNFKWNDLTPTPGAADFGMIAEQVNTIMPDLVIYNADGVTPHGLKYDKMGLIALKAIQELATKVNAYNLTLDADGNVVLPKVKIDQLVLSGDTNLNGSTSSQNYFDVAATIAKIATDSTSLRNDVLGLSSAIASSSAVIASNSEAISQMDSHLRGNDSVIDSLKAEIASLSAVIASNSAVMLEGAQRPIASNSANIDSIATPSASLQNDITLNLTPPSILLATTSAQLVDLSVTSEATFSGQLTAYSATIQDTFKSLGDSFLGNTTVAGDFSIDGTMSISGNSINSIDSSLCHPELVSGSNGALNQVQGDNCGILNIQNSPLATLVNFFNGQATIDKTGKLVVQEITTKKLVIQNTPGVSPGSPGVEDTIGDAIIPTGSLEIPVFTTAVTDKSKVFLTPTTPTGGQAVILGEIVSGSGFVVKLDHIFTSDIKFNWLIIDQK